MRVFAEMQDFLRECIAACDGLQLYGCEMTPGAKSNTLRIFIDANDRPVTADDCHNAGQQIRMQAAVTFPSILSYTIEVSSPGLDRILFTLDHARAYKGKRAKCRTRMAIDGRKNFTGILHGVIDENIVLSVDNNELNIPWQDIEKIRLIYEPEQKL